MSRPSYGIIVRYKDGGAERIVVDDINTRNDIRKLYLVDPDVENVSRFTRKNYF